MPLRTGLVGIILAGLAAFASSSQAGPPVGSLARALEAAAKEDDHSLTGETKFGELADGREVTLTLDVDPDKTYKLYAVCDNDCTELSVRADDAKGHFVDNSSGQDNDTPILEVEDFEGETISVNVFMMNCEDAPCGFAVALAEDGDAVRSTTRTIALAELFAGGSATKPETSNDRGLNDASRADLSSRLKARVLDFLAPVGEIGIGELGTGEARRYFFDADPDATYEAFAVCDCSNLDMVAYDDDDKALASDLDSDNRPGIEIVSDKWPEKRRKGRQRLVIAVKMADCGRRAAASRPGFTCRSDATDQAPRPADFVAFRRFLVRPRALIEWRPLSVLRPFG